MSETPLFEITVTEVHNEEWQGWVCISDSGEKKRFRSLLELCRIVGDPCGLPAEENKRNRT